MLKLGKNFSKEKMRTASLALLLSLSGCGGGGGGGGGGGSTPAEDTAPQNNNNDQVIETPVEENNTISFKVQAGTIVGSEVTIYTVDGTELTTCITDDNGLCHIDVDALLEALENNGGDENSLLKFKAFYGTDVDPDDDGNRDNDVDIQVLGHMESVIEFKDIADSIINPLTTKVTKILLGVDGENIESFRNQDGSLNQDLIKIRTLKILEGLNVKDINGNSKLTLDDITGYNMVEHDSDAEQKIREDGTLDAIHSGIEETLRTAITEEKKNLNLIDMQEVLEDGTSMISLKASERYSSIEYSYNGQNWQNAGHDFDITLYSGDILEYRELYEDNITRGEIEKYEHIDEEVEAEKKLKEAQTQRDQDLITNFEELRDGAIEPTELKEKYEAAKQAYQDATSTEDILALRQALIDAEAAYELAIMTANDTDESNDIATAKAVEEATALLEAQTQRTSDLITNFEELRDGAIEPTELKEKYEAAKLAYNEAINTDDILALQEAYNSAELEFGKAIIAANDVDEAADAIEADKAKIASFDSVRKTQEGGRYFKSTYQLKEEGYEKHPVHRNDGVVQNYYKIIGTLSNGEQYDIERYTVEDGIVTKFELFEEINGKDKHKLDINFHNNSLVEQCELYEKGVERHEYSYYIDGTLKGYELSNSNGDIILDNYYKNGFLHEKEEITYHRNGQERFEIVSEFIDGVLDKKIKKKYSSAGRLEGKYIKKYGTNGIVYEMESIEYVFIDNRTKEFVIFEFFDENTGILEKKEHYVNGKLANWTNYKYNTNGTYDSKHTYYLDGNGGIFMRIEQHYDENGNIQSYQAYEYDGSGYDSDNQNENRILYRVEYYDENETITSKKIRKYRSSDGTIHSLEQFKYNEEGEMIKWTITDYDENGERISFRKKYDSEEGKEDTDLGGLDDENKSSNTQEKSIESQLSESIQSTESILSNVIEEEKIENEENEKTALDGVKDGGLAAVQDISEIPVDIIEGVVQTAKFVGENVVWDTSLAISYHMMNFLSENTDYEWADRSANNLAQDVIERGTELEESVDDIIAGMQNVKYIYDNIDGIVYGLAQTLGENEKYRYWYINTYMDTMITAMTGTYLATKNKKIVDAYEKVIGKKMKDFFIRSVDLLEAYAAYRKITPYPLLNSIIIKMSLQKNKLNGLYEPLNGDYFVKFTNFISWSKSATGKSEARKAFLEQRRPKQSKDETLWDYYIRVGNEIRDYNKDNKIGIFAIDDHMPFKGIPGAKNAAVKKENIESGFVDDIQRNNKSIYDMDHFNDVYSVLQTKFLNNQREMMNMVAGSDLSDVITVEGRLKSIHSLKVKLIKESDEPGKLYKYDSLAEISDIQGFSWLTEPEDLARVQRYLEKKYEGKIIERENKYATDMHMSNGNLATSSGIHYLIRTENGVIEIQLSTKETYAISKPEHDFVYKDKDELTKDDIISPGMLDVLFKTREKEVEFASEQLALSRIYDLDISPLTN